MTEVKNKGGKPPHKPTEQTRTLCKTLSGYGVPQEEIGRQIGINHQTLRLHYRDEIDAGVAQANAKVAQSLYKKAVGEGPQSASSAMFWLKTRAQWSEVQKHEHSGPDGSAIEINHGSARERITSRITELSSRNPTK
jgi:hypothetical protein